MNFMVYVHLKRLVNVTMSEISVFTHIYDHIEGCFACITPEAISLLMEHDNKLVVNKKAVICTTQ